MRLIHITDPHLTSLAGVRPTTLRGKRWLGYLSWHVNRRRVHRREVLEALTAAIAGERPDRIVVSGDLVHIGMLHEIDAAGAWLDELARLAPVFLVPGNHDAYVDESLPASLRIWRDHFGDGRSTGGGSQPQFPAVVEFRDHALVGLSSACPTRALFASGRIGESQLVRLRTTLRDLGDRGVFRCLVIHHPPVPGVTHARRALDDVAALNQVMRECGVELVLHGHMHRNMETPFADGTRIFGTASASSSGRREPASYRVFDILRRGSEFDVEMRLMCWSSTAVAEHQTLRWSVASPAGTAATAASG